MNINTNKQSYIGQTFGRLTVLDILAGQGTHILWRCRCACGAEVVKPGAKIRVGHTLSCGCMRRDRTADKNRTHGWAGTPTHCSWKAMLTRCTNPNFPGFYKHGGRGIQVCERWHSFENFLADMGERPSGKTLDRINNNGHYEPGNCRWATTAEQSVNTRQNHFLTFMGETMTISQWTARLGMKRSCIHDRIARGWSVERALTEPIR